MKKAPLFTRLKDWQLHHRVWAFVIILFSTILLVRTSVQLFNPNPTLFDFELHHFDYGLLLLFVTVLLLLFGQRREIAHVFMAAISFGLILDDLWFIRGNVLESDATQMVIYNASLPVVVILLMLVVLIILMIQHEQNRVKRKKPKK